MQVQREAGDDVVVLAVGFDPSPGDHPGWRGPLLLDADRRLYARLGFGRAPWWRVFSPGTLAFYARAGRVRADGPLDVRQMGGDALVVAGRVVRRWRPRTPVDRVEPRVLVAAARRQTDST